MYYIPRNLRALWLLDFSSASSLVHQPNHGFIIILCHNPFFPHCCEYEIRCQSDTSVFILKLPSVWGENKILIEIHFDKNILDSSLKSLLELLESVNSYT